MPDLHVEIRLFANLADLLGQDTLIVELPDTATVAELTAGLGLPSEIPCLTLVNGREVTGETRLAPGDVVSLLPPLAGG